MAHHFRWSRDSRKDLHFLLVSTGQTIRLQISGYPIRCIIRRMNFDQSWFLESSQNWTADGATDRLPDRSRPFTYRKVTNGHIFSEKRNHLLFYSQSEIYRLFFSFRSSRHWWTFTSFSHVIAILSAENSEMVKLYRYICIFFLAS